MRSSLQVRHLTMRWKGFRCSSARSLRSRLGNDSTHYVHALRTCGIPSPLPPGPLTWTKAPDTGEASIDADVGTRVVEELPRLESSGGQDYVVVAVRRRNGFVRGDR